MSKRTTSAPRASTWIPALVLFALALMSGCNQTPPTRSAMDDNGQPTEPSNGSSVSGLPLPTATPVSHHLPPPPDAFAPTSLEERVYFSPVIVRAHLIPDSDAYGAESVPSSPGVAPTYKAVHAFRFRVIEYLKGTGAAEIVVTERSGNSYIMEAEALRIAEDALEEEGNKELDRGSEEAVLFLEANGVGSVSGASAEQAAFEFREWIWDDFKYRINTLNRAWLPLQDSPGVGGQADDYGRYYLTNTATGATGAVGSGSSSRISLADLRSMIDAAEADLFEGSKIDGYEECMRRKFRADQYLRGAAIVGFPHTPYVASVTIESGSAWWTEVDRTTYRVYEVVGKEYSRVWLEGADKGLFFAEIEDVDKDYSNGYAEIVATARPLPADVYRTQIHGQLADYIPCNYIPDIHTPLIVTVTAPDGTVHEAFFDPVAIGSAIGADGANGALEPSAFTVNGTSTALQSLKWHSSGIITLILSPNASLSGLALDFIALDGSVALTLPASAAKTDSTAGTVTWSSATAPWRSGDQLMLRIRNASAMPTEPTPTAATLGQGNAPS